VTLPIRLLGSTSNPGWAGRLATVALFVAVIGIRPPGALAQTSDPHAVQPERPTVATHAGTVAPGWIEVESGVELDRFPDDSRGTTLSVVTKVGLQSHVQLSVFGLAVHPPDGSLGVGDMALGVKWRVADQAPVLGRFAVLPSVKFPTGSASAGTGTDTTDAGVLLISSHDVGTVSLDVNVGYTHRSGGGSTVPSNSTLWAIALGGPAVGRLGWAAEVYGLPATSGPAGQDTIVAVLLGPTFQVRPWLVFDAGAIVPVTGPQPHAAYVGGVWNIGRLLQ